MGGFFISSHLKMGWWPWRIPSRHQRSQLLYHMAAGNIYGVSADVMGIYPRYGIYLKDQTQWDLLSLIGCLYSYTVIHVPASSKGCLISVFCPRTTLLGRPEFLLISSCQTRFAVAKMPDQTAKNTGPMRECQTTWADNFSLGNGIHFEERRFLSARMSWTLVFFNKGRNECPGRSRYTYMCNIVFKKHIIYIYIDIYILDYVICYRLYYMLLINIYIRLYYILCLILNVIYICDIYINIKQLKVNHRIRGGRSPIQSDCWGRKCARSPGTPERSTPRGFALRPFPNGRASQGDISGELATDIYIYSVYIYMYNYYYCL